MTEAELRIEILSQAFACALARAAKAEQERDALLKELTEARDQLRELLALNDLHAERARKEKIDG